MLIRIKRAFKYVEMCTVMPDIWHNLAYYHLYTISLGYYNLILQVSSIAKERFSYIMINSRKPTMRCCLHVKYNKLYKNMFLDTVVTFDERVVLPISTLDRIEYPT